MMAAKVVCLFSPSVMAHLSLETQKNAKSASAHDRRRFLHIAPDNLDFECLRAALVCGVPSSGLVPRL
jgi:hypothetical protein